MKTAAIILLLFLLRTVRSDSCDTIVLSKNGTDTPNCVKSPPCKTLDFVVEKINVTSPCVEIHIFDNQTLDTNWTITAKNFTMQGMGSGVVISCSPNVGILFNGSEEALIYGIEFLNCGISKGQQAAAVTVRDCAYLRVNNCAFINSSTVGLAIFSAEFGTSQYLISNSLFKDNNHIRYQTDYSNFDFPNSNSYYIQNTSSNEFKTTQRGGGLDIDLKGAKITRLVLNNCSFVSNYGWIGGGAYINANSFTNSTSVQLKDCKFIGNAAGLLGGGFRIGTSDHIPESLKLNIELDRVLFANNSAPHAGGLAYQTKGQWLDKASVNAIVNITNTSFTGNVANFSAAAVGMFKLETELHETMSTVVVVNFQNCSWIDNSIYQVSSGSGVIYTQGISFGLLGSTVITRNYGTAILASSAKIYLWNQVTISHNSGVRGGAVNLVNNAQMVIQKGLKLTFAYNYARLMGGAIYHVFPILGVTGQNEYCVFVYHDRNITDPVDWEADLKFIGNDALISGTSIFLSSPGACKRNEKGEIFTEDVFHFFPNYANQITTSPVNMSFADPSINCSTSICQISVMLGEKMRLTVNAMDAFGNQVKGFAAVSLNCMRENGSIASSSECDYRLEGMNLVEFSNKSQRMPFYIAGNRHSNFSGHILLTWQVIDLPLAVGYLHVRIRNCYLGYIYDDNLQTCICYNNDENVICNDTEYFACVSFGYWYGAFKTSDGTEQFTTSVCSFGSCDYTVNGKCPTEQCGIDGSAYQFHCKLPPDSSDSLCLFNKGEVACSKCQDDFLPTFPNLKCVHKDKCHLGYVVIQVILYFIYLTVAVSLVLLVAKFDFRIGSGQIYCLVFYFSVFKYFVGGVFPSQFLYGVEIFFTSVVQFDPAIFGLIPLCSGMDMSPLLGVFLQLINPIVLFLAICIILYVSSKWPKYAVLNNSRLGINAVCIILYLCFISITQISLTLLTPVKFHGIKGVYTLLDPTIKYFGLKHLGYGLIALLLQITLVIPFLCLLLFSPFLIRFRRLNLTRIKPILDEFQACYKTEYRYFAGYYLACRQLIFLISFISLGAFAYIYILQILSIIILTFHLMIQPYKSKVLNILDGLLILDLVLLSLLHGNTAAVVFDDVTDFKIALIYILVLLPVVYLVTLCVYPVVQFLLPCLKDRKFVKALAKAEQSLQDSDKDRTLTTASVCVKTTIVNVDNDDITDLDVENNTVVMVENIEREPLLFMDNTSDYESNENNGKAARMHSVASPSWSEKSIGQWWKMDDQQRTSTSTHGGMEKEESGSGYASLD